MNSNDLKCIADELRYWQWFTQTPRFFNNWVAEKPNPELCSFAKGYLKELSPKTILDVGSGPVSILHGLFQNGTIIKTADPLSELYGLFFDYKKYKITPPEVLPGEEVDFEDVFDLCHICNALDHCQDPEKVVQNLYRAVKPGGYVFVQGFINEADAQGFSGFHQWNLDITDSGVITANGNHITGKGDVFLKMIRDNGREWFVWSVRK